MAGASRRAVNVLAPSILTSLIHRPKRLVYLSSGLYANGQTKLERLVNDQGKISYSDSKLLILMLSMAAARYWPDVYTNAVDPGWVPTKMGGTGATGRLEKGYQTQAWLATSGEGTIGWPRAASSLKNFDYQGWELEKFESSIVGK